MQFSKDFIRKVEEATDIVGLISEHGVVLKANGATFKGLCPFHSEKTPSFNVYPHNSSYYCFGCQVSGTGIQFLMNHDRLSFPEAIEELAKRAGLNLEFEAGSSKPQKSEEDSGLRCLKEITTFYQKNLTVPEGQLAVNYLHGRLIPEKMWEDFKIGMSPEQWQGAFNYLTEKKFSSDLLMRTGLIKISEKSGRHYDTFRSRLMFPIRDTRGRCIGFGARSMKEDDPPKYLNSPETPYYQKSKVLYGLYEGLAEIRKGRKIIFVEGYLDVIRLHEYGFPLAVAPCGTALTPEHIKLVKRYADQVILLFDGDSAGRNAALKHANMFLPYTLEVFIINLPEGEDPDTFLMDHGKEGFEQLLEKKIPLLDYLVQETLSKFPDSIQGRMKSLDLLLPALQEVADPKQRQVTLVALSERLRLAPDVLLKEIRKKNKKTSKIEVNHDNVKYFPDVSVNKDEQRLLQSLLRRGELWAYARQHLKPQELVTEQYRQLYSKLLNLSDNELLDLNHKELEDSDSELFHAVKLLQAEEVPRHDFKLSFKRIKERNIEAQFQEWSTSRDQEVRITAGRNKREKEQELKQILVNFPTL